MTLWHLERAAYHLSVGRPAVEPGAALAALREYAADPARQLPAFGLPPFELEPGEERALADGDVAELYRRGVHPNVVRNFAGAFGIDYVERYREAGLR